MAALLVLHDESPLGATELTQRLNGFSGSGLLIAQHLERHGLVEIRQVPGVAGGKAYKIALTPLGGRLANGLLSLARMMANGPRST